MKKDLISIRDLSGEELRDLFDLAADLKARQRREEPHLLLSGKTLALIFEKPSLRTRVTFEVAMTQLGGRAVYLAPADIGLGEREPVEDVARSLSRWVDGIAARTFTHELVEQLAEWAGVPVINALTDRLHPCQVLADLLTIQEKRGRLAGTRVVFIGDGNNVANSWLSGAALMGMHLVVACPSGYEPDHTILAEAQRVARDTGARLTLLHDPQVAAEGAEVLYTDAWASMGQEAEREKRLREFHGFQVDAALVARAKRDVLVMHCLPAHRGEEITDEVLDGPHSIVFDQAENRLHLQKAILVRLLGSR
ncbi:MAG: ornithine carbamoyltransferase [Candidatus Methylomirabilales bacterium]